jgi:Fibronectin type III domain
MAIDGTDLRTTRRDLERALTSARTDHDRAALILTARLAGITAEIGNRYEARRHYRRVVESGPAVLGVDHPLVRQAKAHLAGAPMSIRPSRALVPVASTRPSAPISRKRPLIAVTGAALLLVATGAVWLWDGHTTRATTPVRTAAAPKQVTAAASGGAVTVRWQDPSNGTVRFLVSGGVAGRVASITQQVGPGQTVVVINGLDAAREYCFTVVAVYGVDQIAVSDPACTGH